MYIFIYVNFMIQIHIIGKILSLYAESVDFTHILEKVACYFWLEYYHAVNMVSDCTEFQFFLR